MPASVISSSDRLPVGAGLAADLPPAILADRKPTADEAAEAIAGIESGGSIPLWLQLRMLCSSNALPLCDEGGKCSLPPAAAQPRPTLVEALRTARDRHETLLWLGPIVLVVVTMALATLAGAL